MERLLATKQRRAIELILFERLTFGEAAEKSGESLSATRHYYYRGMANLLNLQSWLAEQETFVNLWARVISILSMFTTQDANGKAQFGIIRKAAFFRAGGTCKKALNTLLGRISRHAKYFALGYHDADGAAPEQGKGTVTIGILRVFVHSSYYELQRILLTDIHVFGYESDQDSCSAPQSRNRGANHGPVG